MIQADGHRVCCFDRNDKVAGVVGDWIKGDITLLEELSRAFETTQPDVVYYLCSQFRFSRPSAVLDAWQDSFAVLDCIVDALPVGARLVYVGSCAQYGKVDPAELPVVEDRRCEPVTDYGFFKHGEELHLKKILRHAGKSGCFARVFNVTGPGEPERMVGGAFASRLLSGTGEIVVGNLSGKRDFLDVRDVAKALACLGNSGSRLETYNISSGKSVSIGDYLNMMLAAYDERVEVIQDATVGSVIDIPELVGSNRRLQQLGWTPEYDLSETISELLKVKQHDK